MENRDKKTWRDSPEFKLLKRSLDSKLIYLLLGVFFVLFLFTRSAIFAVLCAIVILLMLIGESVVGVSQHGVKKEITELILAIAAALLIWYGLGFALSTSAPLNAVVSCSMLPNLERGDLVILQGSEPGGIDIQVDEFNYKDISVYVEGEGEFQTNMSMLSYCAYQPRSIPCRTLETSPEKVYETYGPLEFRYGTCSMEKDGKRYDIHCTKSIKVGGTEYKAQLIGDTIVYLSLPTDGFSGGQPKEIIHRVLLKVHTKDGQIYYITKGDNNDRFDIQYDNTPTTPERTVGKVILRVPYLGYFKLFLFGFFGDPPGCDTVFVVR